MVSRIERPGSSDIVLGLTEPLSTVYSIVRGKIIVIPTALASKREGVEILLVVQCCIQNEDKHRNDGPLGFVAALSSTSDKVPTGRQKLNNYENQTILYALLSVFVIVNIGSPNSLGTVNMTLRNSLFREINIEVFKHFTRTANVKKSCEQVLIYTPLTRNVSK